uniref:Uncharacterized protein n=1 Tax=Anguilla anguilla TaxID=7936 RepID=A0A0E9RSW1_ANGAN
MAARDQTTSAE